MNKDYGVPVACRLPADVAQNFADQAKEMGISMSKYVRQRLLRPEPSEQARRIEKKNRIVVSKLLKKLSKNNDDLKKKIDCYKEIMRNEK